VNEVSCTHIDLLRHGETTGGQSLLWQARRAAHATWLAADACGSRRSRTLAFLLLRAMMVQRIGGTTGDTAGGLVELTEIAVLVTLILA
jgi:cobalamin synthase